MGEDSDSVPIFRVFPWYYSIYGHVEKLAGEIRKGAASVEGVEAKLWQIIEALSVDAESGQHIESSSFDLSSGKSWVSPSERYAVVSDETEKMGLTDDGKWVEVDASVLVTGDVISMTAIKDFCWHLEHLCRQMQRLITLKPS